MQVGYGLINENSHGLFQKPGRKITELLTGNTLAYRK
jgi:hypothetical protein